MVLGMGSLTCAEAISLKCGYTTSKGVVLTLGTYFTNTKIKIEITRIRKKDVEMVRKMTLNPYKMAKMVIYDCHISFL